MTSSIPLRDRITAPTEAAVPENVGSLSWRAATLVDAPAILDCDLAIAAVDHPTFLSTLEEIEVGFEHSWVDLGLDTLLAIDASGDVVAWGFVTQLQGQETAVKVWLQGGVRPSHRGQGIGRQLLAWQESRALQMLGSSEAALPGFIALWVEDRNTSLTALGIRHGFTVARHYHELHRDVTKPIEPVPLEGYEIVEFDLSRSEATRLARNDSFRDHFGSQPSVEEAWNTAMTRSNKRFDLSYLAVAPDGEVAGLVMTEVNEGDFEAHGAPHAYINLVGVRRAHRGRGIARALLTRTLEACRDAGLRDTVLDVDSESPTGATALYDSVGYVRVDGSLELHKQF